MEKNLKELENVQSLKIKLIELHDSDNVLLDALDLIIGSWIENGCDLNATNINILVVENYNNILSEKLKQEKPFLYLYPERHSVLHPAAGFKKPIKLFSGKLQKLSLINKKAVVFNALKKIITDKSFMEKQRAEYEKTLSTTHSQLGQGEAIWNAFIIEYDADYYESYLQIAFANHITYA